MKVVFFIFEVEARNGLDEDVWFSIKIYFFIQEKLNQYVLDMYQQL